ncbi:MAG: hypothetical protein Q7R95_00790 [bacterium]|nr:hypothetical protein [bacterium]
MKNKKILQIIKKLITIVHLELLQSYCLGILLFYVIIIFLPQFKNAYFLPKLVLLQICSVFISILELIKIFLSRKKYKLSLYDVILIIYIITNGISASLSSSPTISIWGNYPNIGLNFIYIPTFIILAFIFKRLSKINKKIVLLFIIAGTTTSAIYTIFKFYQSLSYGIFIRPIGLDGHPIWTSGPIGLGLLMAFFFRFKLENHKILSQILKYSSIIIHIVALYQLQSSTTFIPLGFCLLIYLIYKLFHNKQILLNIKLVIIFITFVILAFCTLQLSHIKTYSLNKRVIEIKAAFNLVNKEIFNSSCNLKCIFFGKGQNMSGFFYLINRDRAMNLDKEWYASISNFHNHFIELFFTTGLINLSLWLIMFCYSFKYAIKSKNVPQFIFLIYLLLWQQLYFLLPTIAGLTFVILSNNDEYRDEISFRLFNSIIYTSVILFIIITVLSIYTSLNGEKYFSINNYLKASQANSNNLFFSQNVVAANQSIITKCLEYKLNTNCNNISNLFNESIKISRKLIVKNPIDAVNWHLYSSAVFLKYLYTNRTNKELLNLAINLEKKSIDLNSSDTTYTNSLGLIYLDENNIKLAEKYFLESYALKANDLSTLRHLVEVYKRMNNSDKVTFFNKQINILISPVQSNY